MVTEPWGGAIELFRVRRPRPATAGLARDLDRILADPRLSVARAGVVIRSAATGETLYERDPDKLFVPASLVKLLTAAAALDVLGPGHRFTTSVLAAGRRDGPVLHGDLHLRGTGDPTMLAADYDALAADVAAAGVERVTGALVADDTWFDDARLGAGWMVDDEPLHFASPISALTAAPNTDYDAGAIVVTVAPGLRRGAPAEVTTTPRTGHVAIDNHATTGRATDVRIRRVRGTNRILVTGTVAAPFSRRVSVADATGYAAGLFRDALAAHGVTVAGPTTRPDGRPTTRPDGRPAAPAHARELARRASIPLARLMAPFMKWSNNMHAEILTKAMGRAVSGQGTWAAGLAVITEHAARHGVRTGWLKDGSGLSRLDSMTPRELTAFLLTIRRKPWFPVLHDSLPVPGGGDRLARGTLRGRMAGTPAAGNVHAKTGTMTEVSGLAGYVSGADGEPLAFTVVFNNYLGAPVKDVEDAIAIRLACFGRDAAPVANNWTANELASDGAATRGSARSDPPGPDTSDAGTERLIERD